jgi:hypothetical protein
MTAFFAWFLTPIGKIVGMALAIAAIVGGLYYKIQSDAVSIERARVEKENSDAVTKAGEARDNKSAECERDAPGCVRDDEYRD